MSAYYDITFGLSILLTFFYLFIWHKHFDVHITLIFAFIPISNLGYYLVAHSRGLKEALTATKITYIGGCFLLLFITLSILSLCHIKLKRWMNVVLTSLSFISYSFVLTMENNNYFYKSVSFEIDHGMGRLIKVYGITHTLTYLIFALFILISFSAMIYSFFKKKDVSNKTIFLLVFPAGFTFLSYFIGKLLPIGIDAVPLSLVFSQVLFLIIVRKLCLYDIADLGVDSLMQKDDIGFVSFDFDDIYLGSNKNARKVFPSLENINVDTYPGKCKEVKDTLLTWLEEFKRNESNDHFYYEANDKIYLVTIQYLFDGEKQRGYQVFITDDTDSRKYMKLLSNYNEELASQVQEKTESIVEMHNRLILGMATMVESRDNSTGGHIKRTSAVVRILINEIKNDAAKDPKNILVLFGRDGFSEEFCQNLIQAAPMHDLGKIAVDDAVLRKPGKFTEEEYREMKKHASEGANIVDSILEGTENEAFHKVAVNVAHYHHERWDGSGYPEGLKGAEIPIEARIMAIADVYDALVSKRVYKEAFTFKNADDIMLESFGKHFDKRLEKYYVAAKPKLEVYYKHISE